MSDPTLTSNTGVCVLIERPASVSCDSLSASEQATRIFKIKKIPTALTSAATTGDDISSNMATQPHVIYQPHLLDEIPQLGAALHPRRPRSNDGEGESGNPLFLRHGWEVGPLEAVADCLRIGCMQHALFRRTVCMITLTQFSCTRFQGDETCRDKK